ncbi:hypothetical protein FQN54_000695 [Arachnomyces sp. PD_36]|nr:hypothetical protein FQN54_000695 [Arachnomyces sp. PD_36]
MFTNFKTFYIDVEPGITIHGVKGGSGPALLLLHGYPQTAMIWHHVADELASQYTVVALDLRGYGMSSKPAGDESHKAYSKSVMARDCVTVMTELGIPEFYLCGHDRGARVAHKLCVDYPQSVTKVMLLDICPTLAMYNKTNFQFAKAYFHWFFLIQKAPIPEDMINHDPVKFTEGMLNRHPQGLQIFHPDALKAYLEPMKQPETVHATCEDYRAGATIDLEEAEGDIKNGRHIQCPLMVLYGNDGIVGKCFDVQAEWTAVHATGEVDVRTAYCGHYIPEELPEVTLGCIREFFSV